MAGLLRKVSLRIPVELGAKLNRLARERGESRSAAVRSAIRALGCRSAHSFTELASDLICWGAGPSDVSTNRAYLADLGK